MERDIYYIPPNWALPSQTVWGLFGFIVKATRFMFMWILTSGVIYTKPVIQQLQY